MPVEASDSVAMPPAPGRRAVRSTAPGVSNRPAPAVMTALVYDVGPVRWAACKAIGWLTPRVFWSRLSGLHYRDVPVPALPAADWVRLRPILGGICGTDLSAILQRHHPASILQTISSQPAVLGHENVCLIDEVGPAVRGWRPGDRVVVESSLSCVPRGIEPLCPMCSAGRFTLCHNFRRGPLPVGSMIGWNNFTGGSWAPCMVAHASQLYAVPADIPDEQAVLVDPVAGGLHAVLRRQPRDHESVLVVGAGLLGLAVVASIRALGCACPLTVLARHGRQAELVRDHGADTVLTTVRGDKQADRYRSVAEATGGQVVPSMFGHQALIGGGFDLVYDCIGSGQSLTDVMKYARTGGSVVEVGTSQIGIVDTCPLWLNELTVIGANGRAFENHQGRRLHTYDLVFELVRAGRLKLDGLLTHRFPVSRYGEAFATLLNRGRSGAIKVAFEPGVRS